MIDRNKIPSESDWADYDSDSDSRYAYKMFFGKSLEEVIPRFERGVINACDELLFMPVIPFRYYVFAFKDYVMSEQIFRNSMASDAASCFLGLVNEKTKNAWPDIEPVIDELMPAVEYVANCQALFQADSEIYGDFWVMRDEIKKNVFLQREKKHAKS